MGSGHEGSGADWAESGLAVRDSCGTPREILHPAGAGFRMTSFLVIFLQSGQIEGSTLASAIALIKPGIVYSLASMSTGRPSSRRVDEVTGPIEANRTSSNALDFRRRGR